MQIIQSDFVHPALPITTDVIREYFTTAHAGKLTPLRNPHHEPEVSMETMRGSRDAAVLLLIVTRKSGATMLFTRRTPGIRFAGHMCFPGGTRDAADANLTTTALRETHEEIGIHPEKVEILGQLGDYHTQTGYRIKPIIGIADSPLQLCANPSEVAEIIEVPLTAIFDSASYQLTQRTPGRAHYSLTHDGARIAGPTVSIMMGLYEELVSSGVATNRVE